MRQIPINQAKSILKQLLKAKNQQKVSLLTNKKDRSLTIIVNNGEIRSQSKGMLTILILTSPRVPPSMKLQGPLNVNFLVATSYTLVTDSK